jgi:ribosome-binding protein aMBF1 (putative translation factor)
MTAFIAKLVDLLKRRESAEDRRIAKIIRKRGCSLARIVDGTSQNIIGSNVKKLRVKAGLSQKLLSERLETAAVYVCRGSVSRIEAGVRTVSDIEILGLAKALGVSVERLFEDCGHS